MATVFAFGVYDACPSERAAALEDLSRSGAQCRQAAIEFVSVQPVKKALNGVQRFALDGGSC